MNEQVLLDSRNANTAHAELGRLRALISALPKCWRLNEEGKLVQDVSVVPGMTVYGIIDGRIVEVVAEKITTTEVIGNSGDGSYWAFNNTKFPCYFTFAAAEAANEGGGT